MDSGRIKTTLYGSNKRATLLTIVFGGIFGLGVWVGQSSVEISYWWWPGSSMGWGFVGLFLIFATVVAVFRAGLLATCWVGLPGHVAFAQQFYADQAGFVALPLQSHILFYLLISAAMAVFYGIIGYLLGSIGRIGTHHSPSIELLSTQK
jgi:hypothetical protein